MVKFYLIVFLFFTCRKKPVIGVKRKKLELINCEINSKPDDNVDELLSNKRGRPKRTNSSSKVVAPQKAPSGSRSRPTSVPESRDLNNDLKSPDDLQHNKKRRKRELKEPSLVDNNSTKKPKEMIIERICDSTSANNSISLLPKEATISPCHNEKTINKNGDEKTNNISVQDIIINDNDKLLTNTLTEKNNINHLPSRLELLVNKCPIVSIEKLLPKKKTRKIITKKAKKKK